MRVTPTQPDAHVNLESRIARLEMLQRAPYRLSTSRTTVAALDAFLADVYGIAEPTTDAAVRSRVEAAADDSREARRLLRAMEQRYLAHQRGGRTEQDDARVYELMAVQPFLGWIHSLKRAYILDAAAALTALIETLDIRGPVLDVGCHAGYHANWLAKHAGVPITGIDAVARPVTFASAVSSEQGIPSRFQRVTLSEFRSPDLFEMVYSVDGPSWFRRRDPAVVEFFNRQLQVGGLFVMVGEGSPPFTAVTSLAGEYHLYPVLADVVGGWHGNRFEGAPLLVFVKCDRALSTPPDLAAFDAAWDTRFIAYANHRDTPWREKTQAFFRAANAPDASRG